MRADQQRVRSLLAEAITILCKNCLAYKAEFCVEGLLGITLDNDEVFLVNIKENVHDSGQPSQIDPTQLHPELQAVQQVAGQISRPVPTSRPIPARSPFVPHRTGYRGRGRPRGSRLRSWGSGRRYLARPASRQPVGDLAEPPSKRPYIEGQGEHGEEQSILSLNSESEVIELQDEPEELKGLTNSDSVVRSNEETTETNGDASENPSGETSGNTNDPLVSLDFGDMLQQYEDSNANNAQQESGEQEDDEDEQTLENEDADEESSKGKEGIVVIKPEPEGPSEVPEGHSPGQTLPHFAQSAMMPSQDSGALFGSQMDQSGFYPGAQSGPVFPGSGAMMMPPDAPQYIDPNMAGCSSWPQQPLATPGVSTQSPRKPQTSPRRGPGRPPASAAAGSPSQRSGSSPQFWGRLVQGLKVESESCTPVGTGISKNTMRRNQWAVRTFSNWLKKSKFHKPGECLVPVEEMAPAKLNEVLCQFVVEVRRTDGKEFPSRSLVSLVIGIQGHINFVNGGKLDLFSDGRFVEFQDILKAEMDRLNVKGVQNSSRKPGPLSESDEEELWKIGLLGDQDPKTLLRTLLYLNGKHFPLGGKQEHRNLRFYPPQIMLQETDSGEEYLQYVSDNVGQMPSLHFGDKEHPERCHVHIFKKYLHHSPQVGRDEHFYLTPLLCSPEDEMWYSINPIGVNQMWKLAAELGQKPPV